MRSVGNGTRVSGPRRGRSYKGGARRGDAAGFNWEFPRRANALPAPVDPPSESYSRAFTLSEVTKPTWWSGENRQDPSGYMEADPLIDSTQGYAIFADADLDPTKTYALTFNVSSESSVTAGGRIQVYSAPADGNIDSSRWHTYGIVDIPIQSEPQDQVFLMGPGTGHIDDGLYAWDRNTTGNSGEGAQTNGIFESGFFFEYAGGLHINSVRVDEVVLNDIDISEQFFINYSNNNLAKYNEAGYWEATDAEIQDFYFGLDVALDSSKNYAFYMEVEPGPTSVGGNRIYLYSLQPDHDFNGSEWNVVTQVPYVGNVGGYIKKSYSAAITSTNGWDWPNIGDETALNLEVPKEARVYRIAIAELPVSDAL